MQSRAPSSSATERGSIGRTWARFGASRGEPGGGPFPERGRRPGR